MKTGRCFVKTQNLTPEQGTLLLGLRKRIGGGRKTRGKDNRRGGEERTGGEEVKREDEGWRLQGEAGNHEARI